MTTQPRSPDGGVHITMGQLWVLLDQLRQDVTALKLANVDARLRDLERWKWGMLAIGTASGSSVTALLQHYLS